MSTTHTGFLKGTLIKTMQGLLPIESLVGYNQAYISSTVYIHVKRIGSRSSKVISFDNGQTIWCGKDQEWVTADVPSRKTPILPSESILHKNVLGEVIKIRPEQNADWRIGIVGGILYLCGIDRVGNVREVNLEKWPYLVKYLQDAYPRIRATQVGDCTYAVTTLTGRPCATIPHESVSDSYSYGFVCGLMAVQHSGFHGSIRLNTDEDTEGILHHVLRSGFSVDTPSVIGGCAQINIRQSCLQKQDALADNFVPGRPSFGQLFSSTVVNVEDEPQLLPMYQIFTNDARTPINIEGGLMVIADPL